MNFLHKLVLPAYGRRLSCAELVLLSCGRTVNHNTQLRQLSITAARLKTFEPDYLDAAGAKIPTYPPLNIQIKGYNFDVLESFQSYIHNLAENMGVDVEDAWATPACSYKMATFHHGGTRVKTEFQLHLYERNVQVVNLRSVDAPILLDTIRTALPEGVQLSFHEHTQEHYEQRYIPDPFIDSLRQELTKSSEKKEAEKADREATAAAKAARKQAELLKSLT